MDISFPGFHFLSSLIQKMLITGINISDKNCSNIMWYLSCTHQLTFCLHTSTYILLVHIKLHFAYTHQITFCS